MRLLALVASIVLLTSASAEARHRHYQPKVQMQPCIFFCPTFGVYTPRAHRRGRPVGRHTAHVVSRIEVHHTYGAPYHPLARLADGLVAPLAAKVAEIKQDCGSHLISGVRHTLIAGTRHMSLHAFGKAADVSGNPSCIYTHLSNWPGGYSIDYSRVNHVHISYDAEGHREWGVHFAHGGGYRHYAHRRHPRYAHHRRHYARN